MAKRERDNQSEREPPGEPTPSTDAQQQASMYQHVAESSRARAWEMHLRGVPKTRIAALLGINRATVARIINATYAEVAAERKVSNARKLDGAVARWRRVQEQAWADHDADDERERRVLDASLALSDATRTPTALPAEADGKPVRTPSDGSDAQSRHHSSHSSPAPSVRFQSQRSQYLRIILDAEKEIARLEGLYEGMLDLEAGIAVTFYKLTEEDVQRDRQGDRQARQSAQIASSARSAAIPAPTENPAGGEA